MIDQNLTTSCDDRLGCAPDNLNVFTNGVAAMRIYMQFAFSYCPERAGSLYVSPKYSGLLEHHHRAMARPDGCLRPSVSKQLVLICMWSLRPAQCMANFLVSVSSLGTYDDRRSI